MAASMGAVLSCGWSRKVKDSVANTQEVMIHHPMSGAQGQATDMEIAVKEC